MRARTDDPADDGTTDAPAYRRSTRSPRGEARRLELLELVTDDLGANGLVDFSLRRAARAAGTTHKVLLYHFDGVEDLLTQAVLRLRSRRIDSGLAAAMAGPAGRTLAERVRSIWPVLIGPESWVLDQAIGLAMYDAPGYAALASDATASYLPGLMSLCPEGWDERRRLEVASMVLATFRGFLVDWRTSGDGAAIEAGFAALDRALVREESDGRLPDE